MALNIEIVTSLTQRVVENVEKVIVGKRQEVQLALIALLCEGHLLIEDVPGVGKTMLARSIARSIGLHLPAHSVHARYAAQRCDRCVCVQSEDSRV